MVSTWMDGRGGWVGVLMGEGGGDVGGMGVWLDVVAWRGDRGWG